MHENHIDLTHHPYHAVPDLENSITLAKFVQTANVLLNLPRTVALAAINLLPMKTRIQKPKADAAQRQEKANAPKNSTSIVTFANQRPESAQLETIQQSADASPQMLRLAQLKAMAESSRNLTGLPDDLKSGIENLSGFAMDDVRVHYNSDKPTQLHAHAYAQGTDIHIAPGQEHHLPHEAWHVVQQKQGRVRPTLQMKSGVQVNDDAGLEQEADAMGAKALQTNPHSMHNGALKTDNEANASPIAQRNYDGVKKLRIGVIYAGDTVGISANQLPAHTYVWILSNTAVADTALDGQGVTSGHNKSSPRQIIDANALNVRNRKMMDESRSGGEVVSALFQSGPFQIPRTHKPGNREQYDYSFWRFAAIECYRTWYNGVGSGLGWPDIAGGKTLVETIDSDVSGITGVTNEGRVEGKSIKADWLAEAGVYQWDWADVKDNELIKAHFTAESTLDTVAMDAALAEFAKQYLQAEKDAREAKAGEIFRIYFPEPATRISPDAINLLAGSPFSDISISRGQQIGHKRESIGLIAGLVFLDTGGDKNKASRSKSKLKFSSSFVVKTGLGDRKGAYVRMFLEWYGKAKEGEGFKKLDFSLVESASGFDQSYLNPKVADDVLTWHNSSLDAMYEKGKKAGEIFFNPKS